MFFFLTLMLTSKFQSVNFVFTKNIAVNGNRCFKFLLLTH